MEIYEAKYKALDIAEYIIRRSVAIENPIDQLKLQKILYYVQAKFLVEKNRKCFVEPILAWRFGPVVESVYKQYSKYSSMNLYPKNENRVSISDEDINLINSIVNKYSNESSWFLVEQTHNERPWRCTPQSTEIDIYEIRSYYCSEGNESICS